MNLASARNVAARASRQYRWLHNHAVLSLLWHALLCRVSFQVTGSESGPLFQFASLQQAYKTALPEVRPSPPWRCQRRPLPCPGGQRARPRRRRRPRPLALPRCRRRPRPASCAACAGHVHVPGSSTSVLAAGTVRGRLRRPWPALADCVRLLRSGRPSRWLPPRSRPACSSALRALRRCYCGPLLRSGSPPQVALVGISGVEFVQPGKLPKVCQIMLNAASLRHGIWIGTSAAQKCKNDESLSIQPHANLQDS